MTRVYKILDHQTWTDALKNGRLGGVGIDLRDGYIHLSTSSQVAETARLHFAGRTGLVLLAFEAETLGEAVRWETSRGGQLFPHLYADLDSNAVIEVRPLTLNAEGWPDPGELEA